MSQRYIQTLFPGNATSIVSQVALGPIREDAKYEPLFRNNQDALILASGSVAFEFVNGKCLWKVVRWRMPDGIQELADCLDGNTSKFCALFDGKGLTK